MLVAGFPEFIVNDKGAFKRQEVKTWDNSTGRYYVDELIIPKDVFIECYNKWIKQEG